MESLNLKKEFKKQYLSSWLDKLRFWFLVHKVYRAKIKSLWEANLDKLYFETNYSNDLSYDDAPDRKALQEERAKPLANQNNLKIDEIEQRIAHAKAVKMSYRKNEEFRAEILTYINMLEIWNSTTSQN